tara:strand:- start:2559 stop:2885 length:327 start_codon:yes stop_codon:yes gene_type:complete
MNTFEHALIGGFVSLTLGSDLLPTVAGAVVPDIMLLGVINKKEWLPRSHPVIRWHDLLHLRIGKRRHQVLWLLIVIALGVYFRQGFVLGYASHLVADYFTHNGDGTNA